jgi:hypothetical protein
LVFLKLTSPARNPARNAATTAIPRIIGLSLRAFRPHVVPAPVGS